MSRRQMPARPRIHGKGLPEADTGGQGALDFCLRPRGRARALQALPSLPLLAQLGGQAQNQLELVCGSTVKAARKRKRKRMSTQSRGRPARGLATFPRSQILVRRGRGPGKGGTGRIEMKRTKRHQMAGRGYDGAQGTELQTMKMGGRQVRRAMGEGRKGERRRGCTRQMALMLRRELLQGDRRVRAWREMIRRSLGLQRGLASTSHETEGGRWAEKKGIWRRTKRRRSRIVAAEFLVNAMSLALKSRGPPLGIGFERSKGGSSLALAGLRMGMQNQSMVGTAKT